MYGNTPWPSTSLVELVSNMFDKKLKLNPISKYGELVGENVKNFIHGCL
jgi:hypothetical protein